MALIDIDRVEEIVVTLQKNKRRTIMSSLGVLFSVSFLIMVMGLGGNIKRVLNEEIGGYENFAYVGVYGAGIPYKGYNSGRQVSIAVSEAEGLSISTLGVDSSSVPSSARIDAKLKYHNSGYSCDIMGITKREIVSKSNKVIKGRRLNQRDYEEKRQVIVLSEWFYKSLGQPDIVGSYVDIVYNNSSTRFLVVGVATPDDGVNINSYWRELLVPESTMNQIYKSTDTKGRTNIVNVYVNDGADVDTVVENIKSTVRRKATMAHDDNHIFSYNLAQYITISNLFITAIFILIWIVSIGTLLAGVISISNIMLIVLKERTQEMGVRRALGATPRDIITQIMAECFILTFLTGMVALVVGVLIYRGVVSTIETNGMDKLEALIDIKLIIITFVIVLISSVLAGIIPAIRASKIRPVEAIREE